MTAENLLHKISAYQTQKIFYQILSGLLNIFVLLIIIWLSTFLADHIFYFADYGRWFVLILNGGISVFLIYQLLIVDLIQAWRINRSQNFTPVTEEIGKRFNNLGDRLTNIYQLCLDRSSSTSLSLREYAVRKFITEISETRFSSVLRIREFIFPPYLIAAVLIGSLFLVAQMPGSLLLSAKRILNPTGVYHAVPPFKITVTPGNTSLLVGASIEVSAIFEGPKIKDMFLEYRMPEEEFFKRSDMENIKGMYSGTIENVRNGLFYRLRAVPELAAPWRDNLISETYAIEVKIPPAISELQVTIQPPAYTKLPTQQLEKNLGNIIAYRGSNVALAAFTSKPVNDAKLVLSDSIFKPMQIRGNRIRTRFDLEKSGSYFLRIVDKEKIINQKPIEYQITALEDLYPTVGLLLPDEDIEMPPDASVTMLIEAFDDFGFSGLLLTYQILSGLQSIADTTWKKLQVQIPPGTETYFKQNFIWDFSEYEVGFGDAVKYYWEVRDNDGYAGPKMARTKTLSIRFPSLEQLLSEFDQQQQDNLQNSEDISEESEELKKELEEISRELKREKMDWERKKQIETAIKKQEKISEKLEEIDKSLEEAIKKMAESQLLSPQILEKYQQLQELFSQLMTPELAEAMENLRKSLENINAKQSENALTEFQLNQEQFLENIERVLELFKKVQLEQEIDRMVQLAKKMLDEQEKITNNLSIDEKNQSNIERDLIQQDEKLGQINKSLDKVQKEPEIGTYPETEKYLQQADQIIDHEQMSELLKNLQNDLAKNNRDAAANQSQKLEKSMNELHENLVKAQQEMQAASRKKLMAQTRRAMENLLALSKSEEEILRETTQTSDVGDKFRDLAAQQKRTSENAQRVFQEMIQLSRETFFIPTELSRAMGRADQNMQKSVRSLENRDQRNATNAQGEAMASLNEAFMTMQDAMQQMAGSSSMLGFEQFMERMQQMAKQQGQLNQQALNFFSGEGNKGQLSQEQANQIRRMAAEQRAVQKSLEEMQNEMAGKSETLGRLDNMRSEMEEVVKELEALNIDRKVIERQQRILSRMLDAQRSIREKEYSQKRKAEVGKEYVRKSPDENPELEIKNAKKLQVDLLRALKEGYNPDYEQLIEEYFKLLNQEYLKE